MLILKDLYSSKDLLNALSFKKICSNIKHQININKKTLQTIGADGNTAISIRSIISGHVSELSATVTVPYVTAVSAELPIRFLSRALCYHKTQATE